MQILHLVQTDNGIALYVTNGTPKSGGLFTIHGLRVPKSTSVGRIKSLFKVGTFESDDDFADLLDGLILG